MNCSQIPDALFSLEKAPFVINIFFLALKMLGFVS